MIKQMARIGALALIIFSTLFFASSVAAHGKVSIEADNCTRGMEGSMVHLSTYQPQHDPEAEYCTEIPKEGNTFWVIDLIDQALRDMPIGIQVVRGSGEIVASLHSTYHPDGVIKGESNLDEGSYTVLITGEGAPPLHYEYPLRVQMVNYAEVFRTTIGPTIALLLIAFITIKFLKARRIASIRR